MDSFRALRRAYKAAKTPLPAAKLIYRMSDDFSIVDSYADYDKAIEIAFKVFPAHLAHVRKRSRVSLAFETFFDGDEERRTRALVTPEAWPIMVTTFAERGEVALVHVALDSDKDAKPAQARDTMCEPCRPLGDGEGVGYACMKLPKERIREMIEERERQKMQEEAERERERSRARRERIEELRAALEFLNTLDLGPDPSEGTVKAETEEVPS